MAAAAAGVGLRADPPQPGPWAVGYRTVRITDPRRPGRQLITSLWYPVAGSGAQAGGGAGGSCPEVAGGERGRAGQHAFYPLIGDAGFGSDVAVTDAPPAPGPFPLAVFSHGSAGSRVQAAYLMEALANDGYVVAAPDHPGDTMLDAAAGVRTEEQLAMAVDRSRDVSAVIDALTDATCSAAPSIRPDQIAMVGFSYGGLTAILASIGLSPAPADPRVRVSVGIAATTAPVPPMLLAQVPVPTLLLGGVRDPVVTMVDNGDRAFADLLASHPRLSVAVADATHNSFTEICRQAGLPGSAGVPPGLRLWVAVTAAVTCRPPLLAPAQAQLVADRVVVSFLDWQLRADLASGLYLAGGGPAIGPGVTVRLHP
ncbi:dienelactone hydrolase family protein [Frankia sp. AgB32]|uniref:alpha/beta hydrolase family protein n=1 Tax=Frankia sp. AgB32 TaxID=631119 RepID=UPI00200EB27F|nr:dienelactone hydrolase family protein [Frankia sp. AgB32]MCK9894835.1 dienelactone hydrolase family protein [Frankia sp. AgB32]